MSRRALTTAARWTVGLGIGSLRYLRDRPDVRHDLVAAQDCVVPDFDRDLPPGTRALQPASRGVGPLFHRRYEVDVVEAEVDARTLMTRLRDDPNRASPTEYALFDPTDHLGTMELGTEHVVRLPGPWNGPVRVIDVTDTSFRLATLDGHLEAGQIEFRAEDTDDGLHLVIESWARSGDAVMDVLYARIGLAREMQLAMWIHFLRRSARISGGHPVEPFHVITHVHAEAA